MPKYSYQPGTNPVANFTIQYALGRGGFGEVYFAKTPAGREVALKAILNHEEIEIRGVQNCMNLDSPRLVTIFDVFRDAEQVPWVVMEFIRGPSLREIMQKSPRGLGPYKASYLLRELALALSDLHAAGLVHRDLKPSNVFFDSGRIKIGDYSLTKTIDSNLQSQHTMTVGSVHYMAPEISQGRYDKSVDIYALGAIFYEMLTGHPPHEGESVGEILMKHLQSIPDASSVDERFRGAILRAMDHSPEKRFETAEEFAKTVLRANGIAELIDSFNPTTLSMIGERSNFADATSESLDDTVMAVPQAIVDTRTNENSVPTSLWRSLVGRIVFGFAAIASLYLVGAIWDNRAGIGFTDGVFLSCSALMAAAVAAFVSRISWFRATPKDSKVSSISRRFGVATSSALTFFVTTIWTTSIEPEGLIVATTTCMLSMLVVDWRRFVALGRRRVPGLAMAMLLAIPVTLVYATDFEAWCLFSVITTIAVCVGPAILSPALPSIRDATCVRPKPGSNLNARQRNESHPVQSKSPDAAAVQQGA